MKPSLQLGLNQQLAMTPQLQQAIRLLQMSSLELELEIQATLESNLLLEQIDHSESLSNDDCMTEDWEQNYNDESKLEFLLQKSADITLKDHLHWQLELAHFSRKDKIIATTLIDAISEEGYLLSSLSEIQESLDFTVEQSEIEVILQHIQQFDPLGVGARNLAECLKIQLHHLPIATPRLNELKLLVSEHLEILGKKDYSKLKDILNLNQTELKDTIKIITSLNPKPGINIASKNCEYIIPDVITKKKNGQYIVELRQEYAPQLRINTNYTNLLQSAKDGYNVQILKEHLKEAKWFLKAIETRNETLFKVANCIMAQQKDFLEFGEEKMKPLSLQDIAKITGLHESTISRITTKKHILTPRGIFELKYFFSNAIASPKGKKASTVAIRAFIKKIIAEETSQAPLSDHKIKELLLGRGISIARRTVTKYREAMQLPSSNERKNLGFS